MTHGFLTGASRCQSLLITVLLIAVAGLIPTGCGDDGCPRGREGCRCQESGGCDPGLICEQEVCTPADCTPGEIDCVCLEGACLSIEATCGPDGVCHRDACPAGFEGCPCADGDRCGVNPRGEPLSCREGVCVADSCAPGQTGCVCLNGSDCQEAGDLCNQGFCQPADCLPGELNCPCADGACAAGLICRDGILCVDATGSPGGPCLPDGTCLPGARCELGTCIACQPGTEGCDCDGAGGCLLGLTCMAGRCIDDGSMGQQPPEQPQCYTPCERGLVEEDGSYRPCPADGLMPGCVGGLECVQGSCLAPGASPPGCQSQLDCPDFQVCLQGQCYSTCEIDSDCPAGLACHQHNCRVPCQTGDADPDDCPEGYACQADDGENGFCQMVAAPGTTCQNSVDGSYELNRSALYLSNVNTTDRVVLVNRSPNYETFTVRKLRHQAYFSDGTGERIEDPADDGEECNPIAGDCPLFWLGLGTSEGNASRVQELEVGVEGNGGVAQVFFTDAGEYQAVQWNGHVEVRHPRLGNRTVSLFYTERPEGRWEGKIYYFTQFGEANLAEWIADRQDPSLINLVGNALIKQWGTYRYGPNRTWREMLAILESIKTESWRWPSVQQDCAQATGAQACYLYDDNIDGLKSLSVDLDVFPVPTGVTELPFAVNLYFPDPDGQPTRLQGRIESSHALQYAGNPAFHLEFFEPPDACLPVSGACLSFIEDLRAEIFVGGRYQADQADFACTYGAGDLQGSVGYAQTAVPWLLSGFHRLTEQDPATGRRYRYECRDSLLPFNQQELDELPDDWIAANISLTAANPIPDGNNRLRVIELVDGALINQSLMLIFFKETFESFLPGDGPDDAFSAYGIMLLERQSADLDPADQDGDEVPDVYEGSSLVDERIPAQGLLDVSCSADLLKEVFNQDPPPPIDAGNIDALVTTLIDGIPSSATSAEIIGPTSNEVVHYLCEDNGLFDGGPDAPQTRIPCPLVSEVIFFTLDTDWPSAGSSLAGLDCQQNGSCQEQLNQWREGGSDTPLVQYQPLWRCELQNQIFCDQNRLDLTDGKLFYAQADQPEARLEPLYPAIDQAFRYKTRFRSRTGESVGFAPQICIPDSNQIPYCYDPPAIEKLRERIDCLLYVWRDHYGEVDTNAPVGQESPRTRLDKYLCTNFAYAEACHSGLPETAFPHDGFERLYAELLVMMGDESYTQAFASRFDLAGSSAVSFEGTLFEPGGINLSGAAGYEMYTLYQAAQYYQEALDRFYSLSPMIVESLDFGTMPQNFVGQETVTRYINRLVRAATQKSRAWSQVARRYQNFNRPELARAVIERAYTAAYIESIVLAQIMLRIESVLDLEFRDQVIRELDDAQRRYRMALLDMHSEYGKITDNVNFFGFPPDYIPFPTLTGNEQNAFEVIMARAQAKTMAARERENEALAQNRAFETDAEEFQAELVRLRNNYESQLGDVCGTFQAADGRIYPAIKAYAHLHDRGWKLSDPCGLMGNGAIYSAMGQFEIARVDVQRILTSYDNVLAEVEIERGRVQDWCHETITTANYVYHQQEQAYDLQSRIDKSRNEIARTERVLSKVATLAELMKCTVGLSTDCGTAIAATALTVETTIAAEIEIGRLEKKIANNQKALAQIERDTAYWQTVLQCDLAQIDSNARTATLLLRLGEIELEALRTEYQARLNLSEIARLFNSARRLEQELAEAEQFAINIQAARNDPNVRIYRNDAYINADIAFEDALREAYRATKVYEYYTSQSYARLEQLFLMRMVQYGDYNLQNYLVELDNAFYEFEESFGLPDTRVSVLSLRDDVLGIPRLAEAGRALSQSERIDLMRERLADPALLDESGYLTLPFATQVTELSPLTRNHKILHIEAEMIGSDVGDTVGRVYLRQQGTSTVHGVEDDWRYYRFPERIAVVNPFFNGTRVFDQEVYRNRRLRDRPYVNTSWELIINQRDEQANQDIDLQSLTDVRLYLYYTDFTEY